MSLTGHLRSPQSPVRRFFEDHLGQTRTVIVEANRALRRDHAEPLLTGEGNPSLVGTAADVLLNAWLDPRVPPARQAVSPTMDGAYLIGESQVALMDALSGGRHPSTNEWRVLMRHALLLASFVAAHRSSQAFMFVRDRLADAPASLDEYARRLWRPTDEDDLLVLAPAVLEDHAFIREAGGIVVNPTFSLSRRLGGADADLIADATLWDYKATRQKSILGREDVWQLVGYLLADTDDRFRITTLGISALRWRSRQRWIAADLLAELSGQAPAVIELPDWRARFDAAVPNS